MISRSVRPLIPMLLLAPIGMGPVRAQDAPRPGPAGQSIESINADYRREVRQLECRRLDRLGKLAASEPKDRAEITYLDYFQLAVAKGLYAEAEPVAERLIRAGDTPANLHTLANLVNIVAEADRGEFDESLKDLSTAIGHREADADPARGPSLPLASRLAILDAYYQRLVRADRYDVARKAMTLIAGNVQTPAVRDLAARRGRQLDLVGKPAPPIAGSDLDGKPFRLEESKGDVVLVVFWATWCLPVAQELPWIEETYRAHHPQGFRVVGINVDSAQEGHADVRSIVPAVRRFLVDYNIPWTNLLNGPGEQDATRAYAVAEIPANVLIGRDGKVVGLDLVGPKLEQAVQTALNRKP